MSETIQREKALQIIQAMVQGTPRKEACEQLGISTRTFSRYMERFPELGTEISGARRELLRDTFAKLQEAHAELSEEIHRRATDKDSLTIMPTTELLGMEKRISERLAILEREMGIEKEPEQTGADAIAGLLTGPQLRPGITVRTTLIVEQEATPPAIEGQVIPEEN